VPPAIARVENCPLLFSETCSAHTSSLFWFSIARFTFPVVSDTPLIEIRSFLLYDFKSVCIDSEIGTLFVVVSILVVTSAIPLKAIVTAITTTKAKLPIPKMIFLFFGLE